MPGGCRNDLAVVFDSDMFGCILHIKISMGVEALQARICSPRVACFSYSFAWLSRGSRMVSLVFRWCSFVICFHCFLCFFWFSFALLVMLAYSWVLPNPTQAHRPIHRQVHRSPPPSQADPNIPKPTTKPAIRQPSHLSNITPLKIDKKLEYS